MFVQHLFTAMLTVFILGNYMWYVVGVPNYRDNPDNKYSKMQYQLITYSSVILACIIFAKLNKIC